jgi:hypothetical protein
MYNELLNAPSQKPEAANNKHLLLYKPWAEQMLKTTHNTCKKEHLTLRNIYIQTWWLEKLKSRLPLFQVFSMSILATRSVVHPSQWVNPS